MGKRYETSKSDDSFSADPANLPALIAMWNDCHKRGTHCEAEGARVCQMLQNALWWHRDKLVAALHRQSSLRLVK